MNEPIDRDEAIKAIRANLKRRSGRAWSVTGGRGTSWGWIHITAPPARLVAGSVSATDRVELARLLGLDRPTDNESVPASTAYRREYIDRSAGIAPAVTGTPYWD